jgi:hypothetical protein
LFAIGTILATAGVSEAQRRSLPGAQPGSPGRSAPSNRVIVIGGSPPRGFVAGPPVFGRVGPYGIVERNVNIHIVSPVITPRLFVPPLDLSGIDLDVEIPPWANEFERPRHDIPPPQPRQEVARPADLPKRELPKKEPAVAPPMAADPLEPRADPIEEAQRLSTLGVVAFRGQDYGLAARKFQQALEVDPTASRAYFFLSQSYFALGNYRDAVQMIGLGLGLDRGWPQRPFRPRFDLYADQPQDWQRHLQLLEGAQARQPKNSGYTFLLAHQRWFDDQRDDALRLFRQVRPHVGDPALVDLFLKAAP